MFCLVLLLSLGSTFALCTSLAPSVTNFRAGTAWNRSAHNATTVPCLDGHGLHSHPPLFRRSKHSCHPTLSSFSSVIEVDCTPPRRRCYSLASTFQSLLPAHFARSNQGQQSHHGTPFTLHAAVSLPPCNYTLPNAQQQDIKSGRTSGYPKRLLDDRYASRCELLLCASTPQHRACCYACSAATPRTNPFDHDDDTPLSFDARRLAAGGLVSQSPPRPAIMEAE